MKIPLRTTLSAAVVATSLGAMATTASASDVGYGVGLSYVFGQGFAVGVKAFSDDEADEVAAGVGIDYVFANNALRPNIGIAYLGDGYYGDGTLGYNLGSGHFDLGVGGGWSDADDKHHRRNNAGPQLPPPQLPPPQ